ncbi:hypothetical protein [Pontibacter liquoris]|uniref:hypothetical protein n=1 Tax=Pontibacter liquoris TaxID=2905677 RepID=UPI001FA7B2B7|nr:hypothetical protein [Pontibacter liquoris]
MKANLLRYRLSEPLGLSTKVCAIIIIVGGCTFCLTQPGIGVFLIIAGIYPFIAFKCLEIDLYQGTYTIGINMLGYTIGKKEPYPGVKSIFLKKNRTIHQSTRHSWSSTVSTSFDGYLWLDDETKILLSQSSKKEVTLQLLEPFAQELQVEIKDLTAPLSQI